MGQKIIKLTENDLSRIVKRVINEADKKVTKEELGKVWGNIVNLMEDFIELEDSFDSDDKLYKREFSKYSSQFKRFLEILDPDPREQ